MTIFRILIENFERFDLDEEAFFYILTRQSMKA